MKVSLVVSVLLVGFAAGFVVRQPRYLVVSRDLPVLGMFGGSGTGEGSPEEREKMEQAAKAMGMNVEEYQIGMKAREVLTANLDAARAVGGTSGKVTVERDGHNPPRNMVITITEAGKALGKDGVSRELVTAIKTAAEESRKARGEAQKSMMTFISDEMKKLGK